MALPCLKGGTECGSNWVKKRIYSAPAVKGLSAGLLMKDWHKVHKSFTRSLKLITSSVGFVKPYK